MACGNVNRENRCREKQQKYFCVNFRNNFVTNVNPMFSLLYNYFHGHMVYIQNSLSNLLDSKI